MASKQSKCLFRLPFLLLLLFAQCAAVPHRHRRHHHHHGWDLEEAGHHLIVKNALNECKVPSECRHKIKLALLDQTQVPQCEHVDYFDLLLCLDRSIMSRTNVTELNSRSGQVCCEEIDEVSAPCQQACRSALYAPTLGHEQKLKRIEMVCNRKHGDGIRGDNGLITCLANTHWLVPKHKVMRR